MRGLEKKQRLVYGGSWTSLDIVRALGIKARFLSYLAQKGYVTPSIFKARGSGRAHVYSFEDVFRIAICWRLGVELGKFHLLVKALGGFMATVRGWDNEIWLMIFDDEVAAVYEKNRSTNTLIGSMVYEFNGSRWVPQANRRGKKFLDLSHRIPWGSLKSKGSWTPRIIRLDLSRVHKTVVTRLAAMALTNLGLMRDDLARSATKSGA